VDKKLLMMFEQVNNKDNHNVLALNPATGVTAPGTADYQYAGLLTVSLSSFVYCEATTMSMILGIIQPLFTALIAVFDGIITYINGMDSATKALFAALVPPVDIDAVKATLISGKASLNDTLNALGSASAVFPISTKKSKINDMAFSADHLAAAGSNVQVVGVVIPPPVSIVDPINANLDFQNNQNDYVSIEEDGTTEYIVVDGDEVKLDVLAGTKKAVTAQMQDFVTIEV
jgi:hypothetical protein